MWIIIALFFQFPCIFFFFLSFILGPHQWHMEVPRLGVKWKLQRPACATATPHLIRICDLHHSSWQRWMPNLLREARNGICALMDLSQVRYC